jgi:hypothetical protein
VRDALRLKHHSYRTEQDYVGWITRYILFHDKRHPGDMGASEVEAFLTHLAVEEHVAPIPIALNAASKILSFVAVITLFFPQKGAFRE